MKRRLPLVAVLVYAAFWLAVLFGYLRVDSSNALYEPLRVLAVVVPALVLGFVVARPWVVLAGLVFLLAAALPERDAIAGSGIDVTLTGTYGVSITTALKLVALTTPWVVLGVISRRRRAPAPDTPSEAHVASGPS
jgi:hypothetical protein